MKFHGILTRAVFVAAMLFFCFAAASSTVHATQVRGITESSIKVGGIFDFTGPLATIMKPVIESLRNYTRYTNDQGGINGRTVKLTLEDDRYSIPASVSAYKKLVYRDKIFALFGPGSTGETRVLMGKIMKNKVPCIPLCADREVIEPYKRYLFLSIDTYGNELGVLYNYIIENAKPETPKIAVALVDSGVKAVVIRETEKWERFFGIDIDITLVPPNVMDTTSEVLSMKRKKVDHLIVGHSIPTIALFLKDAKRYGLNAKIYATYSGTSEDVIRLTKDLASNFYGVHPYSSWYDDNQGMAEVREITLGYHPGTEKPYRGKNYSIGWVMAKILYEGMRRAGNDLNIETFIDAMETINDFDTKGICGPITYTPKSHEGVKYDKIFRGHPQNGTLVPVTDWIKAPE